MANVVITGIGDYEGTIETTFEIINGPTKPSTGPSTGTKVGVTTAGLNVRKGPSTSYSKVGYLKSGTNVEIVGKDSKTGWYKIKYNNGYAYVSNEYVTI